VPLDRAITNIAPLDSAGAGDLTFFDNPKYLDELAGTRAGAACLRRGSPARRPSAQRAHSHEPYRAFVAIARTLFPDSLRPSLVFAAAGIAPGAHVHPSARLESGVALDRASSSGRARKSVRHSRGRACRRRAGRAYRAQLFDRRAKLDSAYPDRDR